jgi:hypothetical protein
LKFYTKKLLTKIPQSHQKISPNQSTKIPQTNNKLCPHFPKFHLYACTLLYGKKEEEGRECFGLVKEQFGRCFSGRNFTESPAFCPRNFFESGNFVAIFRSGRACEIFWSVRILLGCLDFLFDKGDFLLYAFKLGAWYSLVVRWTKKYCDVLKEKIRYSLRMLFLSENGFFVT